MLPVLRAVSFLVSGRVALVWSSVSVRLWLLASLPVFLLPMILLRIALSVLLMSVAIACTIVSVVLSGLLIQIVSIVVVPAMMLSRLAVALVVRLIVAVVLLLRRIAAMLSLHRSLLVLIVVGSTWSFVGIGLVVSHAARAMAEEVM